VRAFLIVLFVLLGAVAQAQAPLAELLKDAKAEQVEAAKALNESPEYQRFQRAKRIADGLQAMVDAEKAKSEKKAEK
jgi:hypothetical protein